MSNWLTDFERSAAEAPVHPGACPDSGERSRTVCDGPRFFSRDNREQLPTCVDCAGLLCTWLDLRGQRVGIQVYLHRPVRAGHGCLNASHEGSWVMTRDPLHRGCVA
jgi:hypothetical protein